MTHDNYCTCNKTIIHKINFLLLNMTPLHNNRIANKRIKYICKCSCLSRQNEAARCRFWVHFAEGGLTSCDLKKGGVYDECH